jgi:hypothetical protein
MAPISAAQMRKIYASARELGMDNDLLHAHINSMTGKDSLKELTVREAVKLIDSLTGAPTNPKSSGMTQKQFAYINMLMKDLGWMTEDGKRDYKRLNGFCSKRYGIDHYTWLTSSMASKVIEGLKNMLKEQKERTSAGG